MNKRSSLSLRPPPEAEGELADAFGAPDEGRFDGGAFLDPVFVKVPLENVAGPRVPVSVWRPFPDASALDGGGRGSRGSLHKAQVAGRGCPMTATIFPPQALQMICT